jgi:hypothetical protein
MLSSSLSNFPSPSVVLPSVVVNLLLRPLRSSSSSVLFLLAAFIFVALVSSTAALLFDARSSMASVAAALEGAWAPPQHMSFPPLPAAPLPLWVRRIQQSEPPPSAPLPFTLNAYEKGNGSFPQPGGPSFAILVVLYNQSAQWLTDAFPHAPVVRLTRDEPSNPENVLPNRAYEALPLVRYIVRHYHDLPDRLVFVHGERFAWHALGKDMVPLLASVDLSQTWANFNLLAYMTMERMATEGRRVRKVWRRSRIEDFLGAVPHAFALYCCTQFIFAREHVRRHPLELWRRLDAYLSSGEYEEIPEKWVAIALEHTWVYLLTGWALEPQPRTTCDYLDCTVWGGPRGPAFGPVFFSADSNGTRNTLWLTIIALLGALGWWGVSMGERGKDRGHGAREPPFAAAIGIG